MPFHSPFSSNYCPERGAKGCQDRYTFADTLNACVNEWMLESECTLWVPDKLNWNPSSTGLSLHLSFTVTVCRKHLPPQDGCVSWFHRQQCLVTTRLFLATSSALLYGLSAAWTQPCSSEMLPSSHSYRDSVFAACQLHAAGAQLKGVVKSHQWQLITCMEPQPGDRSKRNRGFIPVWDIVTRLEIFSPSKDQPVCEKQLIHECCPECF